MRLGDFAINAAPDPADDSAVPPGAYYRIVRDATALPTETNTHAWVVRTPTGEWGSLRIGLAGAQVEEHDDGTISVPGRITTKRGEAWTLRHGEWEATDA